MDASRYQSTDFGRPARTPGDTRAFTYYLPNQMPRELRLAPKIVLALSEADSALGLLNGLGRLIPEPNMLLGPLLMQEALAQCHVEEHDRVGDHAKITTCVGLATLGGGVEIGVVIQDGLPVRNGSHRDT